MKNRIGFTLIEILIGLSLLSLTAVMAIHVGELIGAQKKRDRVRASVRLVDSIIEKRLQFTDLCKEALRDPASASAPGSLLFTSDILTSGGQNLVINIPKIRGSDPTASENISDQEPFNILPLHGIRIDKLRLTEATRIHDTQYLAYLEAAYDFSLSGSVIGGNMKHQHVIMPLILQLDKNPVDPGPTKIISCGGALGGASIASLCSQIEGTMSNGKCQVKVTNFDCPSGMLPVRVVDGQTECEWIGTGYCPTGYLLASVSMGKQICRKVPVSP